LNFLDALRSWADAYARAGGRRDVDVRFEEGQDDRPKQSAWIIADAAHATGQLTIWESGECDTEAASATGDTILLRSRTLRSSSAVMAVADDLFDHLADYSGT
jgi:hypothetical protein